MVLDFDGTPASFADVDWGWYAPNAPVWFGPDVVYHSGETVTAGANGGWAFPGVTSVPGSDALGAWVWDSSQPSLPSYGLHSWANDFSAQSWYELRAGRVRLAVAGFPDGAEALVTVGDAATSAAYSDMPLKLGSGFAAVCPPGFDSVMVGRPDAVGAVTAAADWASPGGEPVLVAAGTTAAATVTLDWDAAKRGRLGGPRCRHSVRPGDTVTFVLTGWPVGYEASFYGWSYARDTGEWFSTKVLSAGAGQTYVVRLRIPADAPLGDLYEVAAYRSDDPAALLHVYDYLQLCRFVASRTSITRGQAVQLRGFAQSARRAVLFKRHKAAGQPATLAARGWTRVGRLVTRSGQFRSDWLRPTRTTWYTVRYAGHAFTAFTPVVKVRVR